MNDYNGYDENEDEIMNRYHNQYRRPPLISRRAMAMMILCLATAAITLLAVITINAGGSTSVLTPPEDVIYRPPATRSIPVTLPWNSVRGDIVIGLDSAKRAAAKYARSEVDKWSIELAARSKKDFVPAYTSYAHMNLMMYKTAYLKLRRLIDPAQPTTEFSLQQETEGMFRRLVLREPIAQLRIEKIASDSIGVYLREAGNKIDAVPSCYNIPRPTWEQYIRGASRVIRGAGMTRSVPLVLKTGSVVATGMGLVLIGPSIDIGRRIVGKMFGRQVTTQTTTKLATGFFGRLAGPVFLATAAWDIADHVITSRKLRPILTSSIDEYLAAMSESVNAEIMNSIGQLELQIIAALPRTKETSKDKEEAYANETKADKPDAGVPSSSRNRQGGTANGSNAGTDCSGRE